MGAHVKHRVSAVAEWTLDDAQVDHLRHFINLSLQPANDWSLMGTRVTGQDDFASYRYQLAYIIYAAALTHRHRLPAAPGVFQPLIQRLIDKLLEPEVWTYWKDTARGGAAFNAHLSDDYVEQWDPVVRDNIMYSAYVQSAALLHDYLFASDRYAQPGSLTFHHWTPLWGGDPKHFEYDRDSLTEQIYWQMVKNGFLGVACEPNCIFQICNQPAILGFRLHDLIHGTDRASDVIANYEKAWSDFGRLDENGHYNVLITEDSHVVLPNADRAAWSDAWLGTLMSMWNKDYVRAHYPAQIADYLVDEGGGLLSVRPTPKSFVGIPADSDWCDFGWVAAWATEMGDDATRDGLLAHADRFMNPTRRGGGLYYPRNDRQFDDQGHYTEVDPMVGNALLPLARLNIADGFETLFGDPWPEAHFTEPALSTVDVDVDVRSAYFADGRLCTDVQRRQDAVTGDGVVAITRVVAGGRWDVELDGVALAQIDSGELRTREAGPGIVVRVAEKDLTVELHDYDRHRLEIAHS
jgi:Linalool dehydratase/isomerase